MKRRARSLLALGSIALGILVVSACSGASGAGVMVVMRTDMTFPDKVQNVGLFITQIEEGRSTSLLARIVPTSRTPDGQNTVSLPTELAIESNGQPSQVRVRVVAYGDNLQPLAMRESRTSVSTEDIRALPMPILWMNEEALTPTGDDAAATGNLQSSHCGADSTLDDDGACAPIDAGPLGALAAEEPLPTEGKACNPNCFDVSQCFKPEFAEDLDDDFRAARAPIGWFDAEHTKCGVALGARGEMARAVADRVPQLAKDLAVAVRVPAGDGAHCTQQDPDECYIVIDAATKMTVDRKQTPEGERLWALLPTGICRKWEEGKIIRGTAVAVPGCARKGARQTMCTSQEVGCTTDLGWDGKPNPRAGKPGTPPAAASVCRVPGATSIVASGDKLLVMTTEGQIVALPPSLETCAPASRTAGVGTGIYRLTSAAEGGAKVGFMRLGDKAGTATLGANGYEPVIPEFIAGSTQAPWGVGFAAELGTECYVHPAGGRLGTRELTTDARTPFVAVTNGVDGPAAGVTFATSDGASLSLVQCPRAANGLAVTQRQQNGLLDASVPLHAARLRSSLFVLLQGPDGKPGLARYDGAFEQAIQKVALELPVSESPMGDVVAEMTLAAGSQSLFFGDSTGRIYRVAPGAVGNDAARAPVVVAYRGYEPVHSVYYAPIPKAAGSLIDGFLYWVTWPDGEPAKARVQRVGLNADGGVVIPEPVDAGGSSSSSSSGGSSSGTLSSSSSGNTSSGSGSSSSGNTPEGGASSSTSGQPADAAADQFVSATPEVGP